MSDILRVIDDVDEGSDNSNVGQVILANRTLMIRSDVSGTDITLRVFERGTAAAIYTDTIAKAGVIYDTPQVDGHWKNMGTPGYNFRHQVRQVDLAADGVTLKSGRTYRFEYTFPTQQDGNVRAIFVWKMRTLSS